MADKNNRFLLKINKDYENKVEKLDNKLGFDNKGTSKNDVKYFTNALAEMVSELKEAEDELKTALIPFVRSMFKKFHAGKDVF